jgi:hypothetical protein
MTEPTTEAGRTPEPLDADEVKRLRIVVRRMEADSWTDPYRYHPRTVSMLLDTLDRVEAEAVTTALTALRAEVVALDIDTDQHHDSHCSCLYDGVAIEQAAVLDRIDKALGR